MMRSGDGVKKFARPAGLALMMAAIAVAIPVVFVARVAAMPIKGLGEPR